MQNSIRLQLDNGVFHHTSAGTGRSRRMLGAWITRKNWHREKIKWPPALKCITAWNWFIVCYLKLQLAILLNMPIDACAVPYIECLLAFLYCIISRQCDLCTHIPTTCIYIVLKRTEINRKQVNNNFIHWFISKVYIRLLRHCIHRYLNIPFLLNLRTSCLKNLDIFYNFWYNKWNKISINLTYYISY